MFACGTGSYQPVCAFIQLGARGKVRDTLVSHGPIAEGGKRTPSKWGAEGAWGGWPASLAQSLTLCMAPSSPGLAVPGCPVGMGPSPGIPFKASACCRAEHTSLLLPTRLHMSSLFPASPWADISSLALAGSWGSPHAVGDPLLGIGARTVPVQPS